jgi:hypothetical protein
VEGEPDQLLVDLADRLRQRGLSVVPRYGVPGGVRLPLVLGHPDHPDQMLLAVLTDDAEYAAEPSLRIRDRHDVQRLVDRGWGVHMAFSTAVFLDPQAEVENVLASVRRVLAQRRARPLDLSPGAPVAPAPPSTARAATPDNEAPAAPPEGASPAAEDAHDAASVEAEFSAMAARLAEMEAALLEMEAEFETDIPDDIAFESPDGRAAAEGDRSAPTREEAPEPVVVPVLDSEELGAEPADEDEALDIDAIDVAAAEARAKAVRAAAEGATVSVEGEPEPLDAVDLDPYPGER